MKTILTFNVIKRMFYTYSYGRSKITFEELYEMFDDLGCLNNITKEEFELICRKFDKNGDNLMEIGEIYEIYKYIQN